MGDHVGILVAALVLLGPPALAVYITISLHVAGKKISSPIGAALGSLAGALLAYAWLVGTLNLMAQLAPLYRGAENPLAQGFVVCYPVALGMAAAWWLALALILMLLLRTTAGRALDLALTAMKWCLVIAPACVMLTVSYYGGFGGCPPGG